MSELVTAITTGITAFSATNIDNLVVLMLFFAQVNATFHRRHIFIGLFLGFTAIIVASLPGYFGGMILPQQWIRLLGLVPIALGISYLFKKEDESAPPEVQAEVQEESPTPSTLTRLLPAQTYSVAAVMFANGSDNIGVYAPLFAGSTLWNLLIILGVFFLLLGVEYYAADRLTRRSEVAEVLTRYGNALVPPLLVGLGVFIVWENMVLTLGASGLCLVVMLLLKRYWRSPSIEPHVEPHELPKAAKN